MKVMVGTCCMPIMDEAIEVAWLIKIGCCAPVAMIRFCGMAGALDMCDGVGGAWIGVGVGAGAICCTCVVIIPLPPFGVPVEPDDGCSGFGFGVFALGGIGGPDPLSSPLLTYTLSGRPMHLMLERYFLAFEPALSSNSLGVSHSSDSWMHLPLDPDSYLLALRTAVVLLQRTLSMLPNLAKVPVEPLP